MLSCRRFAIRMAGHLLGISVLLIFMVTGAMAQQAQMEHAPSENGGELTLEQCIDIALKNNSQVIISERQVENSEAVAYGSWSNVMPTVNMSILNSSRSIQGDVTRTQDVQAGTNPDGSIKFERREIVQSGRSLNNFTANLQLQQPIYNGGRSWNTMKRDRMNVENSMMNVDATRHQITSNVKVQYYNVLKSARLAAVIQEQVKLSEEQLRRSQSMYEIGSVAKVDVLQASAQLGQARINLFNQQKALAQAKGTLNNAMGIDVNTPIDLVDVIESENMTLPPAPMFMDEAIGIAMQENPAIKRDIGSVNSSRVGVRISKGALWPTVTGTISYSRNNSDFNRVYGSLGRNYAINLGLNISLSVLNGTQTFASIQQSQASQLIAEETLEQTKRSTTLTIRQALLDLETTRQVIDLSNANILASAESMRLAEERYRVGSGTLLDVFNAQVSLIQAKSSLVTAQYDYKIAQASLDQALGRR